MIKKIKSAIFKKESSKVVDKGTSSEIKREIDTDEKSRAGFKINLSEFDMKIKKDNVQDNLKQDFAEEVSISSSTSNASVNEMVEKLDKISEKNNLNFKSLVQTEAYKVEGAQQEDILCSELDTLEYSKMDLLQNEKSKSANSIIQIGESLKKKYISLGYAQDEANDIFELQQMNYKAVSVDQILDKSLDMLKIRARLIDEYILEDLSSEPIYSQTIALIHYNLVMKNKVEYTQNILDDIKTGNITYNAKDLKALDLYYEKEIISYNATEDKLINKDYGIINHQLKILYNSIGNNDEPGTGQYVDTLMSSFNEDPKQHIETVVRNIAEKNTINFEKITHEELSQLNELSKAVIASSNKNVEHKEKHDYIIEKVDDDNINTINKKENSSEESDDNFAVVYEMDNSIENIDNEVESEKANYNVIETLNSEDINPSNEAPLYTRTVDVENVKSQEIHKSLKKVKLEIDKYGIDEFTKEFIQLKYEQLGLNQVDAGVLLELQEKNYDKLNIQTVIESQIPSAYIKNLWFNEILTELLFKFKMSDQTLLTIRYNMIDKIKIMDTQILLDEILFDKDGLSEFDIRKKDLYFEDELIEMKTSNSKQKQLYYNSIHEELSLLRKAASYEKHTLSTTGDLYDITRERVRQIDSKLITRLGMMSASYQKHLNPNFTLGLNPIAMAVLEHKSINPHEYFINGYVKPTRYFLEEYNLRDEYYIYNEKVIPKNNKALFDEYMTTYSNKQHSAQQILEEFLQSLKNAEIYDEVMRINEVDIREVQGRLSRMENIIHAGAYYRKHNIRLTEIEELVERVENLDLPNVFSAKLLIDSGVTEGLDIIDENELHNILKQNKSLFTINIRFSRNPHMTIGNVDFVEELYQLTDLEKIALKPEEAMKELSSVTGIKEQTLLGSYMLKIVNKASTQDLIIDNIEELEEKLSSLNSEVIHVSILEEKYDVILSTNFRDLLKVKSISGYKLRNNWLLAEQYKTISDYIMQNVDNYGIFSESKLGASKYVHNYLNVRKSLRSKNIYKFNSSELFYIDDEDLITKINNLKDDVLYEFELPFSLEALMASEELDSLIRKHELEMYGFSTTFLEDVILSVPEIILDGKILINKNNSIIYSDYLEGFVCSIYDYEEEFTKNIGCEPPTKYLRKLEEEGIFIKDDVLYLEKEIYLNELRSVI